MPSTMSLLKILLLVITAKGEINLRQQWITSERGKDDQSIIWVSSMRADCQGGTLLTATGLPMPVTGYIDVEVVLPAGYDDCTPQNSALTTSLLQLVSVDVVHCYKDEGCQEVYWSPEDLLYSCTEENRREEMLRELRLKFDVYCKASDDISLTSLQSSATVAKNSETCQDGRKKSVIHSFLQNPCSKPLEETENLELRRLTDSLNRCLGDCKGVSLTTYDFGELTCLLGDQRFTHVGVYWGCRNESRTTLSLTTTNSYAIDASGSTQTQTKSNDSPDGIPPKKLPVTHDEPVEPEENMSENDGKYLTALIVVSVLLFLVVLALIGVIIYFRTVRDKNRSQLESNKPPSKQTLYRKMSPHETVVSTRYESATSIGENKLTDYSCPDEEYADNTYEMVNTYERGYSVQETVAEKQRSEEREGCVEKGDYAVPRVEACGVIVRTDSAKYSDGYLMPTISKPT
ncbi:uncharacterized protein [Watersipora subatra]|uniref:uncharacterized protein n=1 Tax=Watersipora subatra TaxID=2589382 RepID=UPI00355B2F80